ncbi:MAG TPA: hypothetical protein VJ877_01715 [Bacteroidales bacterium]|nr:hypothetical protein [Bacteroidales bacterium]
MKNYLVSSKLLALALIISIGILNSSCDKENKDEKPELPPVESLVMDFSDFNSNPTQTKGIVTTYDNFVYSFYTVAFWSSISTGSISLPVAAYAYMMDKEGEYIGDNSWQWTYQFTYEQSSITATLTAERIDNEQFSMEMVIESPNSPDGFKWFDGVIRYDHTAASWNVYKYDQTVPPTATKMLEVSWTKDYEEETSSLTYTYVYPGQNETGSYITFGKDPSLDYNAWYTISLTSGMVEIQWDTETKAGRVKSENHFEDTNWHCWIGDLQDITCPAL